ncbi:DnaA regulatory inactivator Hda [Orrella sp. NBD-18]|uniref:DnaA regulatory inactivator Hda n=1 Tax=Sheuella amnicola TaxID=2707330 RepID=A0A6B2R0G8_9BURK|nr:DnaA regulatory inactivator Hda [Sheuella amnicola]NDY83811.1 DnaA regulatory inactivator Hda [Sheuella amnicola]
MSRQLLLEIIPAPDPTLDNTLVGQNGAAIDAARALQPGRALYLWGPPGAGRSHLLRAMAGGRPSVLVNSETNSADILSMATSSALAQEIKLVAVDDIQLMDDAQLAGVFALYNHWRESATTSSAFALAVTGDRAPMMMSLREDLRTRLGWDLVFRLEPLSDADKYAALKTHARQLGLPLSDDVLDWMLTHYSRDIRQLFALVDAIDRYSLSKHRAVTVPLMRTMLSDREFLQS